MAEKNRRENESGWRRLARLDVGEALGRWVRGQRLLVAGLALTALLSYGYSHHWRWINGNKEWFWRYQTQIELIPMLARSLAWLLPAAMALGGAGWWVHGRLTGGLRRRAGLALLLAWGCWLHATSWTTLHDKGPSMLGGVMIDPFATGFTNVALSIAHGDLPPLREVLGRYPQYMPHWPIHVMTHPPGNVVLSVGVLRLMTAHPRLARGVERLLERLGANYAWFWLAPLSSAERATVLLLGLLMVMAGLLTALPLFALIRGVGGAERTAWIAAVLWIHDPALMFFTPSYDQLYALIVLTGLWAWRRGLDERAAAWGTAAGLLGALGVFLSFKLLIWLPLAGLLLALAAGRQARSWRPWDVLAALRRDRGLARRLTALTLAAAAAFAGCVVLLWLAAGVNMAAIFQQAWRDQALVMAALKRSYAIWLAYGPWDVLSLAGPMLSLAALAGWGRALWRGWRRPAALEPMLAIFPLGLAAITLSGLMLGENARLLLMFGPGLAWGAAAWLDRPGQRQWGLNLAILLAMQHIFAAICLNAMVFISH